MNVSKRRNVTSDRAPRTFPTAKHETYLQEECTKHGSSQNLELVTDLIRRSIEVAQGQIKQIVLNRIQQGWYTQLEHLPRTVQHVLLQFAEQCATTLMCNDEAANDKFHYFHRKDCGRCQVERLTGISVRARISHQ